MKRFFGGGVLAAISICIAVSAHAGVSEDFAGCDGLMKPKRSDDGMRGEATMSAYGGSAFFNQGGTIANHSATISACDRALTNGNLRPEQTLRLAHILRARGAARLQLEDYPGAMADFDAANAAAASYAGDFFYDRSMGVSLALLRAIALSRSGQPAEALAIADDAAAKRPYSIDIQRAAALLRTENNSALGMKAVWQQVGRIDPDLRGLINRLQSVPDDLAAVASNAGSPTVELPSPVLDLTVLTNKQKFDAQAQAWNKALSEPMVKAYALVANQQEEAGLAWAQATSDAMDAADEARLADAGGAEGPVGNLSEVFATIMRSSFYEPQRTLFEARLALAQGRLADAAAAFGAHDRLGGVMVDEFITAYAAARDAIGGDAPVLARPAANQRTIFPQLAALADSLLIKPESERKLIDYQKSRPDLLQALVGATFSMGASLLGGIERTAGFRSSANEDGSIKVEYTGNTTSGPVVQEMTLLRAAELAQEAGRTHFRLVERKDYQQYRALQQNGFTISRTLSGYQTHLTIRFIEEGESQDYALDAIAVIDALGPIYYGS